MSIVNFLKFLNLNSNFLLFLKLTCCVGHKIFKVFSSFGEAGASLRITLCGAGLYGSLKLKKLLNKFFSFNFT